MSNYKNKDKEKNVIRKAHTVNGNPLKKKPTKSLFDDPDNNSAKTDKETRSTSSSISSNEEITIKQNRRKPTIGRFQSDTPLISPIESKSKYFSLNDGIKYIQSFFSTNKKSFQEDKKKYDQKAWKKFNTNTEMQNGIESLLRESQKQSYMTPIMTKEDFNKFKQELSGLKSIAEMKAIFKEQEEKNAKVDKAIAKTRQPENLPAIGNTKILASEYEKKLKIDYTKESESRGANAKKEFKKNIYQKNADKLILVNQFKKDHTIKSANRADSERKYLIDNGFDRKSVINNLDDLPKIKSEISAIVNSYIKSQGSKKINSFDLKTHIAEKLVANFEEFKGKSMKDVNLNNQRVAAEHFLAKAIDEPCKLFAKQHNAEKTMVGQINKFVSSIASSIRSALGMRPQISVKDKVLNSMKSGVKSFAQSEKNRKANPDNNKSI